MKISEAKVKITGNDILGIANDFLEIDGLNIIKIEIDEMIRVYGNYQNKIHIPFMLEVGLGRVRNNIITGKLFKIDFFGVGIFKSLAKTTLSLILKRYSEIGIKIEKDYFYIDLDIISKYIPFVYFKVTQLNINKGEIEVFAENVIYSQDKPIKKISDKPKINEKVIGVDKIVDNYTSIRKNVKDIIPEKYNELEEYILIIPDIIALLYRLLKDKRIEKNTKIIIGAVIVYIVSPSNAVKEKIPIIKEIDDLSIIYFAFEMIFKDIPEEIILENWQGENEIFNKAKEGIKIFKSVFIDKKSVFDLMKERE